MNCFAIRPARPAEPGDTILIRGLCPLKLPFDIVCLYSDTSCIHRRCFMIKLLTVSAPVIVQQHRQLVQEGVLPEAVDFEEDGLGAAGGDGA